MFAQIETALLLLFAMTAYGDEIAYDIRGISGPALENVRSHVEAFDFSGNFASSESGYEKLAEKAVERTRNALRPFGYYQPEITAEFASVGAGNRKLVLSIRPGPAVTVASFSVDIVGDGAKYKQLREWRSARPLAVGAVLDQTEWLDYKQLALDIADSRGYLQAAFTEQSIAIDLNLNRADLTLVLDTGQRSMMGKIVFEQDVVRSAVLDSVPRFSEGDPYTRYLIEKFHSDLWKVGYFTELEFEERARNDVSPPVVDLHVKGSSDRRNIYQGSVGVGSDTETRLQAGWTRQPMSLRGDRIDTLVGWQQRDNEFVFRSNYRIPRRSVYRQYWIGEFKFKTETQDFAFRERPDDEDEILLASGRVDDFVLRGGRLKVRNLKASGDQAFETLFAQYLHERREQTLVSGVLPEIMPQADGSDFESKVRGLSRTLAFGYEWDRPAIRGSGFQTVGSRDHAWVLASDEAWGSERDFAQFYASTRRHYSPTERWKFLLRAEVGYTNAVFDEFTVDVDDRPVTISVTRLPDLYRFRAGGSGSVRGYGFENLSDNDLGSNHIITASAEVEFKFLQRWSAAAFVDIGNAFNEWSERDLKRGVGVGIRWYTIAGPVRVDFARALDYEGKPWRVHFTIGTPLL